jgi:hypothetical protein
METSAKTGFNAMNVFVEAAKTLYKDYLIYGDKLSDNGSIISQNTNNIQIDDPNIRLQKTSHMELKKEKKCCFISEFRIDFTYFYLNLTGFIIEYENKVTFLLKIKQYNYFVLKANILS